MRTITTTKTVYTFDELSHEAKQKAIEKMWDINVDYEWWDSTYEDANRAGIEITSFDIDRREIEGRVDDPYETARAILKDHGPDTETYKGAEKYIQERDEIVDTAPKDELGEFEDLQALDDKLDLLDTDYREAVLNEYLTILRNEYEYHTSEEQVIESIKANEYEFEADGTRV